MPKERPIRDEPPIIVDRHEEGMAIPLQHRFRMSVTAVPTEDGHGAVYVAKKVRSRAKAILQELGFQIISG